MKQYKDDDGRQIANMDNLDRRGILASWFGFFSPEVRRSVLGPAEKNGSDSQRSQTMSENFDDRNMGSEIELTREERMALIKYNIKYSLAMGMVFLVAFAILLFLLTRIW